jgi:hypothetical protein
MKYYLYSQNTQQSKLDNQILDNPTLVKLEARKLFISIMMRPFY